METTIPPSYIDYMGLAIFKKDKLIGWLDEQNSKGYNYIEGNVKYTIGHIPCPNGGKFSFAVLRSKASIKADFIRNKPHFHIRILIDGNVAEANCHIDLTKTSTIQQIQSEANNELQKLIEHMVIDVQEDYKTDIFGFGEVIHRDHPP